MGQFESFVADIMQNTGTVPIPPYLNRSPKKIDDTRYQTVYSRPKGSVAAPTAGLHFTEDILNKVNEKGIKTLNITLHVARRNIQAGTIRINSGTRYAHREFCVEKEALKSLIQNTENITAVGTTSVRTLESTLLAWNKTYKR